MADIGGLIKLDVDGNLRDDQAGVEVARDHAKAFFKDSNNVFQGKKATITALMHDSDSDKNDHVTVQIADIEKVKGFDKEVTTYWFCQGDKTYWNDVVHVRKTAALNHPKTYVQISKEMFDVGSHLLQADGAVTYWIRTAGGKASYTWAGKKGETVPIVMTGAAHKDYKRATKEEWQKYIAS